MSLSARSVFDAVWRDRHWFVAMWFGCVALSVVVALLSRPIYRAEAVVAPVGEDRALGSLSGFASQFGGIASLAGVSIGKDEQWQQSLGILRSRHLIEELVTADNLLPVIVPKTQFGIGLGQAGGNARPTMGDAVKVFRERILQIREDAKTGLVAVRIEWFDPKLAAAWANDLVAIADAEIRGRTISDANSSLKALKGELDQAEGVELRAAISRLMEAQLKAKMAAGIRTDFALRVIDIAVPSDLDKRVQPTRTTMVLAGALFGVILAVVVVILRREWRRGPAGETPRALR